MKHQSCNTKIKQARPATSHAVDPKTRKAMTPNKCAPSTKQKQSTIQIKTVKIKRQAKATMGVKLTQMVRPDGEEHGGQDTHWG